MKLPANKLEIPENKIVKYLLNLAHADGGGKAVFFMRFGFTLENWDILANALKQHAAENDVIKIEDTHLGQVFVVEGQLIQSRSTESIRSICVVCKNR